MIIDKWRKISIKSEATDDADYKIYSDGSCINNGVGVAAIIYNKNRITPYKLLKAYLGSPEDHNTYKAEIIGAILAIWILENSPITIRKKISLYTDNQSVIQALRTPNTVSGQYLIQALLSATNNMARNLMIWWISSHSNVYGNKNVDCLAKQAAEGCSSATIHLPPILRWPLLTSTSAIKQKFNTKIKKLWLKQWNTSPRKERMAQLGENFPFKKFITNINKLTCKQTSTILQIRCGHFPLNHFLHKIKKIPSNTFQACLIANDTCYSNL